MTFGNYRLTDGVMYTHSSILYNETVIREFNTKLGVKHKLITNDTLVPFVDPHPIDSVVNRNVSICSNSTFLLMIYLIRSKDYRMRQILRRIIPQGIIVKERQINRVFVIGVNDTERPFRAFKQRTSNMETLLFLVIKSPMLLRRFSYGMD